MPDIMDNITQECRYCANTGWFYGDPDLHSYCGCAFGKLREQIASEAALPALPADLAGLVDRLEGFAVEADHAAYPEAASTYREAVSALEALAGRQVAVTDWIETGPNLGAPTKEPGLRELLKGETGDDIRSLKGGDGDAN